MITIPPPPRHPHQLPPLPPATSTANPSRVRSPHFGDTDNLYLLLPIQCKSSIFCTPLVSNFRLMRLTQWLGAWIQLMNRHPIYWCLFDFHRDRIRGQRRPIFSHIPGPLPETMHSGTAAHSKQGKPALSSSPSRF